MNNISNHEFNVNINSSVIVDKRSLKRGTVRGYHHSVLATCCLPLRDPQTSVWHIEEGKKTLHIESDHGIPYGSRARLLLAWLMTSAYKNESPIIDLPNVHSFHRELGLPTNGRSHGETIKQALRLARCQMQIVGRAGGKIEEYEQTQLMDVFDSWKGDEGAMPTRVILNPEFFESLTKRNGVFLNLKSLAGLASNTRAMDIYLFLACRLWRLERQFMILWADLQRQFGHGAGMRQAKFKKDFLTSWHCVKKIYPDAQVKIVWQKGVIFSPSPAPK